MDPVLLPALFKELIPIVSIIAAVGAPVLIVFVVQHFKLRNRELQAEVESRRLLGERDKAYLESRIERLEQILMSQGGRGPWAPQQLSPPDATASAPALLAAGTGQIPPSPSGPVEGRPTLANPGLFEPPPVPADAPAAPGRKRAPTR